METNLPTVAKISLSNLAYNYQQIKSHVNKCRLIGVVKANGYGHGAVEVSKELNRNGCDFFAVARLSEALELRKNGIPDDLIIFGALLPHEIEKAAAADIRITVADIAMIAPIKKTASTQKKPVNVHINVDTGMGRTGIQPHNLIKVIDDLSTESSVKIEGLYTHFATSDEADKSYAERQLTRFKKIIADLSEIGKLPEIIHCANSGAILDMPETCSPPFNAARPGIILYGHYPSVETTESIPLKQVMTFKTTVAQIRELKKGMKVSYGCRYTMENDGKVAVLPVGYADGYQRAFTNKGKVLIRGKEFPVIGTVTMDQIIVLIKEYPIEIGEEVVLWGKQGEATLQATKLGDHIGTISYELCCGISKRVPRIY